MEAECEGGPRAPSVRRLFRDPRATPALYGVMKEDLGREVELWAEEESLESEGEEGVPGPP